MTVRFVTPKLQTHLKLEMIHKQFVTYAGAGFAGEAPPSLLLVGHWDESGQRFHALYPGPNRRIRVRGTLPSQEIAT
jgi:hypothetical protein